MGWGQAERAGLRWFDLEEDGPAGVRLRVSSTEEAVMEALDRITQNPDVMGGRPCIRGMRVTVGMLVGQIGVGRSIEQLLSDYPYLEREDVLQAIRYAD